MGNRNADHEEKEHLIRELRQEELLSKDIVKYLEGKEVISQEIFDSLSHELQTPVVTIKAYIDMLLKGYYGELRPKQKEKLGEVKENTDFLINVISKMLEKSKTKVKAY